LEASVVVSTQQVFFIAFSTALINTKRVNSILRLKPEYVAEFQFQRQSEQTVNSSTSNYSSEQLHAILIDQMQVKGERGN